MPIFRVEQDNRMNITSTGYFAVEADTLEQAIAIVQSHECEAYKYEQFDGDVNETVYTDSEQVADDEFIGTKVWSIDDLSDTARKDVLDE